MQRVSTYPYSKLGFVAVYCYSFHFKVHTWNTQTPVLKSTARKLFSSFITFIFNNTLPMIQSGYSHDNYLTVFFLLFHI